MDFESLGLEPWQGADVKEGLEFGRLTVLATGRIPNTYRYFAVCACSCGALPRKYRIDKLKSGHTTSCGCAQRDAVSNHGLHSHPLYARWAGMIRRCYVQADARYSAYGGRGITVCDRWHDLQSFIEDMEGSFYEGASLDRIDNNAGYSPENCRWVPMPAQASNKRCNIMLTHNGETMSLASWSAVTGINYQTLWDRVQKYGWSARKALTTQPIDADTRCAKARRARKRAN